MRRIRVAMLVLAVVACCSQILSSVRALEIEIPIPDKGPTSGDSDRQSKSPNSRDNDNLGPSDKSGDGPIFVNLNDYDNDLNSVVVKQLLKSLHSNIITNDMDDDELGEEPKDMDSMKETEDEVLGRSYYEQAKELRNRTHVNTANVYALLSKASDLGNKDAKAEIAEMHLLDVYGLQDIEKAGDLFEQLAAQGHSRGLFGLGFMHATGIGRPFNQAKAITYYWMAAIKGNLLAKMSLAYRYYYGINVKQNCEQALLFYMETAENVASKITFSNGLLIHKIRLLDEHENESTVSKADPNLLSYYELIAEKGDTNAQIMLGQMYYQGTRGVPVDYEKAKFYFEMTTSSKSGVGMAYLGKIHLMQTADKKPDYLVANYYFTMGAEEKNAIALTGLGYMHMYGLGMPVNYAKALKYFFAAGKDKYPEAHLYIGIMYFEGLGIEKNYEHASFHFQSAALSGNVLAYYYLGKIYAYGLSSMRSCSKAVELLKTVSERHTRGLFLNKAYDDFYAKRINESYTQYALFSELGYEIGQSNLAFIHEYADIPLFGNYNKSDVDKLMLMYWNRASEQGYGLAKVKSGDCYFYGQGTSVDYEMAAYSYQTAADLHRNSQAMFNLGYMHEQGIGLVKDTHLAKRYYDQAMEFNPDAKLPATLAIWKLQFVDFIENFNMVNLADQIVRNNGDMLFSIVLIIILLYFQNWHH